jgi:hypothetical protein
MNTTTRRWVNVPTATPVRPYVTQRDAERDVDHASAEVDEREHPMAPAPFSTVVPVAL